MWPESWPSRDDLPDDARFVVVHVFRDTRKGQDIANHKLYEDYFTAANDGWEAYHLVDRQPDAPNLATISLIRDGGSKVSTVILLQTGYRFGGYGGNWDVPQWNSELMTAHAAYVKDVAEARRRKEEASRQGDDDEPDEPTTPEGTAEPAGGQTDKGEGPVPPGDMP